ncbi:hypothetical protein FJTKL_08826 [Diaporthe vaccinii]|uniref:5'-deoxynucleotidase n=1 Tax=Diaporthe vaccinii TaxID=105482 RepID=A0ABR4EPQ7_9PEZI
MSTGQWTVEAALQASPHESPVEGTSSLLPFLHLLERLKTTKRAGWKRYGIDDGESVADHSHRMSVLAMLAPPPGLDVTKCIKMCLIHDLAESVVGDITPTDNIPKPEKHRREAETLGFIRHRLLGGFDGGKAGEDIHALWREFEDSQTPESIFAQDLDKVELLLQMLEYEKRENVDLSEFTYVSGKVVTPRARDLVQEILGERSQLLAKRGGASDAPPNKAMMTLQDQYYGDTQK